MKISTVVTGVLGVLLLLVIAWHTNLSLLLQAVASGGWALAWLLPYRALFFAMYALGWSILLQSMEAKGCASFGYLFWVTSVREAVDRLLPVSSIGGSFVGVRLMRWRGFELTAVSASVIAEIVLTLVASYFFSVLGVVMLSGIHAAHRELHQVILALLLSFPVPLAIYLLLRYGSVFQRLEKIIRFVAGSHLSFVGTVRLDQQLKVILRDYASMALVGGLELIALVSGSFEIWFAMRLFGRPVTVVEAIILESMTVALRHAAFMVPAGIGVQEAGLVVFGRVLGIDSEFALAISMVKRARELLWGVPALLSWQWQESRRLSQPC